MEPILWPLGGLAINDFECDAKMNDTYELHISGLTRNLKVRVADDLVIASFMFEIQNSLNNG